MKTAVLALGAIALAMGALRLAAELAAPRRRCRTCGQVMDDALDPDDECQWHWGGIPPVMGGA